MIYAGKRPAMQALLGTKEVKRAHLGDAFVFGLTCSVSQTLDGVTSDAPSSVAWGDGLVVSFTPESGKALLPSTVRVTMGGVDVTDTAFDLATRKVTLASVTGNVEVAACAAVFNSSYEPLPYIATTGKNANGIVLNYKPNSNTKLVLDVSIKNTSYSILYGIKSPNTSPSSSAPQFYFWTRRASTSQWAMAWGSAAQSYTTASANGLIKTGARLTFTCDKGTHSYVNTNGEEYSQALSGGSWTQNDKLILFNSSSSTTTYAAQGKIHRATIGENGVILQDHIPARRLSDDAIGLYDLKNGGFIINSNYTSV